MGRAPPPALNVVEAWLARRPSLPGLSWLAFADPDGAVGLVPSGPGSEACPALLVLEQADGYGVTVCNSAAIDPAATELGPFATIEDMLHGIGRWMVLATAAIAGGAGTARAAAA